MILRQPLHQRRRHQQQLTALTRNEISSHPGSALNPADGTDIPTASHGLSGLAAAGGRLLRPAMHKPGRLVPAATAALLLLSGIGSSLGPERSSGLARPRDRNARRAMAGVVQPLATPLPRLQQRPRGTAPPRCGSGTFSRLPSRRRSSAPSRLPPWQRHSEAGAAARAEAVVAPPGPTRPDVRDHDRAPSLLDPDSDQAP
jgi:hypothetical protein